MLALEGLRVLDLTQYEAGTSCTQWLGWLGADVVKVEPTGTGEPGRFSSGPDPDSGYFVYWNSNKRSVAIDLRQAEGRDLLLRMAPHYDVLAENYGPGVMERLGLDYETLRGVHPAIIYASVKGFGGDGPYASYKCYDMVAQAAGGAFSMTGTPDGPPMRPGPTLADCGSGLQLALAITAAYVQKLRDGIGQRVEVSMQEATTYFLRTLIGGQGNFGEQAVPRSGNGFGPAQNLYPCAPGGPNDHLYILAVTPRQQEALCRTIEREDLIPRLGGGPQIDPENRAEGQAVYDEIAAWTRRHGKYEAMKILGEAGVPSGAVLDSADLFRDPHLQARGFIENVEHEQQGELRVLGCPLRLSASPVESRGAPLLGRHTEEVLRADLGLSDAEFAKLQASRAIEVRGGALSSR